MAEVFEEGAADLSDSYIDMLLSRPDFWIIAAFHGGQAIGGITAHTLPMTRTESREIFVYDLAVRADYQRMGVGAALLNRLRAEAAAAGIRDVFVAADEEDLHAIDFYRAVGGTMSTVKMFDFTASDD